MIAAAGLPDHREPSNDAVDPAVGSGGPPDPLAWWLDRQVALTLTDGRRCRAWVRAVSSTPLPPLAEPLDAENTDTENTDTENTDTENTDTENTDNTVTTDNLVRAGDTVGLSYEVIGRMTLTLFPEPLNAENPHPYPAEVTTPVYAGAEHGRPHAVRLLTDNETRRAKLQPRRPPTTTTMIASRPLTGSDELPV